MLGLANRPVQGHWQSPTHDFAQGLMRESGSFRAILSRGSWESALLPYGVTHVVQFRISVWESAYSNPHQSSFVLRVDGPELSSQQCSFHFVRVVYVWSLILHTVVYNLCTLRFRFEIGVYTVAMSLLSLR